MKRYALAGLTLLLMCAHLIAGAPTAAAGCIYGGQFISKCDGPVQPDGTWQRCVAFPRYVPNGFSSHLVPQKHCAPMGPHQPPGDPAFNDPPVRIAP